jgi:hypothetical protein
MLRFDLYFSYWIFIWYIFYLIFPNAIPSPMIFLIIGLILNLLLIVFKKQQDIILYAWVIIIFKCIPIMTLWPPRVENKSITFGILLLLCYIIWIKILNYSIYELYFPKSDSIDLNKEKDKYPGMYIMSLIYNFK